jgi:hypothetical protein
MWHLLHNPRYGPDSHTRPRITELVLEAGVLHQVGETSVAQGTLVRIPVPVAISCVANIRSLGNSGAYFCDHILPKRIAKNLVSIFRCQRHLDLCGPLRHDRCGSHQGVYEANTVS